MDSSRAGTSCAHLTHNFTAGFIREVYTFEHFVCIKYQVESTSGYPIHTGS